MTRTTMSSALRRVAGCGALVVAAGLLVQPFAGASGDGAADGAAGAQSTPTAVASAGQRVDGLAHQGAPAPADVARAEAATAARPAVPARGPAQPTTPLDNPPSGTTGATAAEPVGLSIFRNSVLPATAISGGYANVSQRAHEPSTDNNGKNLFQTGNWYASYSKNGGGTWTPLDPFTIFGSGFCCDQVVVYDSARDRWFWILQYNDRLVVANSAGSDMVNWCFYGFNPQNIGSAAGNAFDYNDVALGTRNLYLSSNIFNSAGSFVESSVLRLPLSEMITCAGFGYNFIRRNTEFTYKVATSGDVAHIASNNLDSGTGTTLRVLTWPESSGSFSTTNRAVPSFTYMTRNSGQNCGSTDGVVKNWCQFGDSRVLGGGEGGGLLYYSWNIGQSGSARPKPFTRLTILDANSLAVTANYDIFNSIYAFQYLTLAVDRRGHAGMLSTWGGGTNVDDRKYPSPIVFIRDDVNPSPGFNGPQLVAGGGNACLSGSFYRWGDYQTLRAVRSADGVFMGSTYAMQNNACSSSSIPRSFHMGRERSRPGFNRYRLL